jgi:hypothetical protein
VFGVGNLGDDVALLLAGHLTALVCDVHDDVGVRGYSVGQHSPVALSSVPESARVGGRVSLRSDALTTHSWWSSSSSSECRGDRKFTR